MASKNKRQHFHVTYWGTNGAASAVTFRTYDRAEAEAKLVEFGRIAPKLYDGQDGRPFRAVCYLQPCSDARHEKHIPA